MTPVDDSGPELGGDEALAAEYVLGVLPAEERAQAARRIALDQAFARLVEAWEQRLAPMAGEYAEVEPPAAVRAAVERRLFAGSSAPDAAAGRGLWQSLALWRGLAATAIAVLALYVAIPFQDPTPQPAQRLVGSLAADDSGVRYLVVYDERSQDIGLSHVTGEREAGRDFELWAIEGQSPPVSLGVIPVGATVHLTVSEELRRRIAAGVVFAISLEPEGGSPTGAPTGPVVAAGDLKTI